MSVKLHRKMNETVLCSSHFNQSQCEFIWWDVSKYNFSFWMFCMPGFASNQQINVYWDVNNLPERRMAWITIQWFFFYHQRLSDSELNACLNEIACNISVSLPPHLFLLFYNALQANIVIDNTENTFGIA